MKRENILIKILTLVVVLTLTFTHFPVAARANDTGSTTDRNLFAFYYSQLKPVQQDLYKQLYFDTYDENDPTAYSVVTADLDKISVNEIYATLEAYFEDNSYLHYIYDIPALKIHDMSQYYEDCLLLRVPLLTKEKSTMIDIFSSYLSFCEELAVYYIDDPYTAIKTLVSTTLDLVRAELVNATDALTILETGLEYMNHPAITTVPSVNGNALIYVFYEDEWYAIDLLSELAEKQDNGKLKHFLLGKAEAPKVKSSKYVYPKLAATRYIHTYYVVEYSFEKRPCQPNETCEEAALYHLYIFNNLSEPTTHWNIRNSNSQLVEFNTVHEFYVPLLDYPTYNVNTILSCGEYRDVISNYSGPVLMRTISEWWHQETLSAPLTAYVHHEAKVVTGYRYTRKITD